MKRQTIILGTGLSLIMALMPAPARALTDEEVFRDFRFNFVNPGARSLGLGGAFIAAADDATAAQANPAALHYVYRQELFLEYRAVRPDTQAFTPSAPIGGVTNLDPFGSSNNPDPFFLELQSVNNREDRSFPSFASYAVPFNLGQRRARVAVSRQVVLDVENTLSDGQEETSLRFATNEFPLWVNDGNLDCAEAEIGTLQFYSVCNTVSGGLDAELVHYNVSVSYSFLDDFSLGVTATLATLDMTSEVLNVAEDPRGVLGSVNPRVDIGGGVLSPLQTRTSIDDSDSAFTYSIGLHWHPDKVFPTGISPIKFGLVYRKGAELEVEETKTELDAATGQFVVDSTTPPFGNTLREPDRFGLGISYDLGQHWTFALDGERIQYSDLLENYRSGINFFTSANIADSFPDVTFSDLKFDVDDATVVHAGAEFFARSQGGWGFAVRAGYFNAPDNRIRLEQVTSTNADPVVKARIEAAFRDVFRGGEDDNHVTAGLSLNTPGGFQLQIAGDFSDAGNEFLASTIFRFGKTQ